MWDGLGVGILVGTLLEELGREADSEVDRPGPGNLEVVRFGLEVERLKGVAMRLVMHIRLVLYLD